MCHPLCPDGEGDFATESAVPVGMARLCLGSGILIRRVEFWLNPAFAVLFLPSQDLLHQDSLACLVLYARLLAWFLAGAARRLFWLTHSQILLQPGVFGSAPARSVVSRDRPSRPLECARRRAASL